MDSADAATPLGLGAWAWIRGYFTPATLFLVVNLVIGTIALTSRATQQRRRKEHYYHDDGYGHHLQEPLHPQMEQQPGYGHYYHPEQTLYAAPPPPAHAPLARTSSVLDRLRSFGLYRFRSGDFPPEYGAAVANHAQDVFAQVEEEETAATAHYARSRSEPAPAAREDERRPALPRAKKPGSEVRKSQVARAAPRVVEVVADAEDDDSVEAVGGFRRGPSPLQQEYHYQEEYVPPPARARAPAPAPLQRTSSVLDRLRSLGLYGFLAPDQPPAAAPDPASDGFATPADEKRHAHYDRSRSEPSREQQGKKEKTQEAKSRMAKSTSGARKNGQVVRTGPPPLLRPVPLPLRRPRPRPPRRRRDGREGEAAAGGGELRSEPVGVGAGAGEEAGEDEQVELERRRGGGGGDGAVRGRARGRLHQQVQAAAAAAAAQLAAQLQGDAQPRRRRRQAVA